MALIFALLFFAACFAALAGLCGLLIGVQRGKQLPRTVKFEKPLKLSDKVEVQVRRDGEWQGL
jgi:hypothetical protein